MPTQSDAFQDFDERSVRETSNTGLVVAVSGYEGPLDLLLTLARDQKIDLGAMSLLAVVDQYMAFLATHLHTNLDLTADHLIMAAWLALLKSRLLIPARQDTGVDPEATEVAEALADQIRRMTAMEEAAAQWLALPQLGRDHFVRGVQQTFRSLQRPEWVEGYVDFLMTCAPSKLGKPPQALRIAPGDLFSVEQAIGRVEAFLATRPEWVHLEECLPRGLQDIRARSAIASHLVASLELCRQEKAELRQDDTRFGPIWLRRRPP